MPASRQLKFLKKLLIVVIAFLKKFDTVVQVLLIPCVEKLQQVVQNDYSQQYNEMGWRLYHQEHHCQPQVCPPNPCDYQWVWWPVCPQPVVPEYPCGGYRPPCPPPAPECGGPRLVYRP